MATPKAVVLLAVCLFFSCGGAMAAATDFDFFYYVLSWPGSFCRQTKVGCCVPLTGPPELNFFVKGLYTAKNTGHLVTKCNNTRFLSNLIRPMISEMNAYMASIRCPSQTGMEHWEYLWTNFGVCSHLNTTVYFKSMLQLRSSINLLPKLKRLDVVPLDGYTYPRRYVQAAINDAVGVATKIRCSVNTDGDYQLSEIWMCVAKDGTTLIACPIYPKYVTSSCKSKTDQILFGTFTEDMMHPIPLSVNPIEMSTSLTE